MVHGSVANKYFNPIVGETIVIFSLSLNEQVTLKQAISELGWVSRESVKQVKGRLEVVTINCQDDIDDV